MKEIINCLFILIHLSPSILSSVYNTNSLVGHNFVIHHPVSSHSRPQTGASQLTQVNSSPWVPLVKFRGRGQTRGIKNVKSRNRGFHGPIMDHSPWSPMIPEESITEQSAGNSNSILEQFQDMVNSLEDLDLTKQIEEKEYHPCYRTCSTDPGTRMTCAFNFIVANYYILSPHCMECPNNTLDCSRHGCLAADGRQRAVAVVNKEMPGPAIRVCEGDTVIVDVTNKLVGQETSIHWHGIEQKESPWMDGVPSLTQCPIPQGSTFRYKFDTPRSGTYFWHSHTGVQRADGVTGPLIVRQSPEIDVNIGHYDYDLAEHELIFWDFLSGLALTGHIQGHVTDERELPRSILVQGRGFPTGFFDDFHPYETLQSKRKPFVPPHEVRVRQNLSYRFRFISNGITLCPIELSVEGHSMLVIASDGNDVIPIPVQSLVIQAGERFDVVIRADQPIGSYWMKFRGLLDCEMTNTYQLVALNYEGIPKGSLPRRTITTWAAAGPAQPGLQLNPVNIAPGIAGQFLTVAEMSSVIDPDPEIIQQEIADHQFYLTFDFNRVPNINFGKPTPRKSHRQLLKEKEQIVHFLPQLNFISHTMPIAPPLTQPESIESIDRCNFESKMASGTNCSAQHCECTHWLNVGLNSIVELVLVDMGVRFDAAHPFHLHGHSFRVLGLERLGNTTDPRIIKQWDLQGLLPRRRRNAPIKDTVYVPDGGYTILRFRADNPGYWFFHCHIEFHQERGMGLIIQVGDEKDVSKAPEDFPRCGNYVPPVIEKVQTPTASSVPVSPVSMWQDYNLDDQFLRLVA